MCTRLSGQRVVPFIGVYSTQEHPLALVFEFMGHLNLREYLRNNHDVERRELVSSLFHLGPYRHLSVSISAPGNGTRYQGYAQRRHRSREPWYRTNHPLPTL